VTKFLLELLPNAMPETPALSRGLQAVVLILAALFEVGGDALIRAGLRGRGVVLIALGFLILGSYGLVLNQIAIDFSKLLGVYVGLFAVVSVLFGKFLFHEAIPPSTWLGLGVVLTGSLIIQWG
jgi:drug/metabolite transporter superfamily protein YnfA